MAGLGEDVPTALIHTNPRDPEVFYPAESADSKANVRRSMHLPASGIGIGFLGRFVAEKGPLLFLDSLQSEEYGRSTSSDVWAVIAGRGPLEAEVRDRSAALGVHFLGSLDYWAEVPHFFRSIDVFVAPSWKTDYWEDQSPRTVIEAMLSGCVVVGSDSGAIPSMIDAHGVIVEEKNVHALAAGIRRGIELVAQEGGNGPRQSALQRYSGPEEARRLLAFWEACRS